MVSGRASKYYEHFIQTVIFYQNLFNNSVDINSILSLPYPLYRDIMMAQIEEKKKEKKQFEKNQSELKNKTKKIIPKRSRR